VQRIIFYFTCIALILTSTASAKDYAGSYVFQNETGAITLTLQEDDRAGYRGNLTANGNAFDLRGIVQNGLLTGTLGDDLDALVFQAELKGSYLTIIIAETDDNNNPIPSTVKNLCYNVNLQ
jgi:hypothetical protein